MDAAVFRADDSRTIALYDVGFRYAIGADETDGVLSMIEVTIPPRSLVKPHTHSREDEFTLVLSGSIGGQLGDETVEEIPPGSWLVKPRDVRHALWNTTEEPARILEVVAPGGLERYFEAIAPVLMNHGPEWTKRYNALADEYGLTVHDDWSRELQERYGITL
jgi:quercetin dioxygenase-like cupin family protein